MRLEESDLDAAVAAGLLNPVLRGELVAFAAKRRQSESSPAAPPVASAWRR